MRLDTCARRRYLARPAPVPASRYLDQLREESPDTPLATFASWADARRWLAQTGIKREASDVVLKLVLLAFRRFLDEDWHNILLYLFWDDLARICRGLRRPPGGPDALDSEVCWAFLHALHRLDLERRRTFLGRKIINDTTYHVRLACAAERRRQIRPAPLAESDADGEPEAATERGAEDPAFFAFEFHHDRDWACARLKELARRGRISEADALILIGCHLYGRSLEEMSVRLGLTYEMTKRRRQRAATYLRRNAKYLSPDLPDTPLRPLGRRHRREKPHG